MRHVESEVLSISLTNMRLDGHRDTEEEKCNVVQDNTLSPSKLPSSSLNFGDGDCGEPLSAQELLLDFTPTKDDEADEEKCRALFEFLENTPENGFENAMVFPDKELTDLSEKPADKESTEDCDCDDESVWSKTAVSMLSFVKQKGYIDRMFETKAAASKCSLASREYPLDRDKNDVPHTRARSCKCCDCRVASSNARAVSRLNADLDQWTEAHPKVMDPPGHNPELKHCILQRKYDNKCYLPQAD